jgi:tRNA (guanine-N(7)-)-methyltransferase
MPPAVTTLRDLLAGRPAAGACEVEIGCGNGHFLASYAASRPETLLVGIDLKARRCRRAREKAEKRGLANVHILHGAAEVFIRDLPPRSVDAFHIYFPDPWPKSRHRKRRFFTMEMLNEMTQRLRPGGRLYFGTDFFDYYLQAKVLVALHPGLLLTSEPAPQPVLSSLFGQRFIEAEKTIRIFSAVRVSSPDDEGKQEKHEGKVDQHVQADERG